jgi:hypothetical protein
MGKEDVKKVICESIILIVVMGLFVAGAIVETSGTEDTNGVYWAEVVDIASIPGESMNNTAYLTTLGDIVSFEGADVGLAIGDSIVYGDAQIIGKGGE